MEEMASVRIESIGRLLRMAHRSLEAMCLRYEQGLVRQMSQPYQSVKCLRHPEDASGSVMEAAPPVNW